MQTVALSLVAPLLLPTARGAADRAWRPGVPAEASWASGPVRTDAVPVERRPARDRALLLAGPEICGHVQPVPNNLLEYPQREVLDGSAGHGQLGRPRSCACTTMVLAAPAPCGGPTEAVARAPWTAPRPAHALHTWPRRRGSRAREPQFPRRARRKKRVLVLAPAGVQVRNTTPPS